MEYFFAYCVEFEVESLSLMGFFDAMATCLTTLLEVCRTIDEGLNYWMLGYRSENSIVV